MPHYHLPKIRYLVAAAVYLLFTGPTIFSTPAFAQPGAAEPASSLRTWSQPVSVSNPNDEVDSTNPEIARCADGTVYVVWEQGGKIWYRVRVPSEGWRDASPILAGQNAEGASPTIAVSSDCVLHLAWSKLWRSSYEIFYTFNEGHGFELSNDISRTDYGGSFQPDIAVDSSGEPHVVWIEISSGGGARLYEAGPTPGYAGWPKGPISGAEGLQILVPALVIDQHDQFHLTWMRQDDKSTFDILYKRPEDWLTAIVENLSSSSDASRLPDIATSENSVVVVWQESVDGDDEIFVRWRHLDRVNFGAATNLSNSDGDSRAPTVTADGFGDFIVAWDEGAPINAILTRPWHGIGDWGDTTEISAVGMSVKNPAVAASPMDGHVYAVWVQKDGSDDDTWDIYFSEMELKVHRFYLPVMLNKYEQ